MLSVLRHLLIVILHHPVTPARVVRSSPLRAPSPPSPTSPRGARIPVPSHDIASGGLGVGVVAPGGRPLRGTDPLCAPRNSAASPVPVPGWSPITHGGCHSVLDLRTTVIGSGL